MAGGGALAGGEPLILGRPVAGARHGGFWGSVGRWWGCSGERFRYSGEREANLASGAALFEWLPRAEKKGEAPSERGKEEQRVSDVRSWSLAVDEDGSSVRRWRVRRGEVVVAGPGGVLRLDWEQREEEEGR